LPVLCFFIPYLFGLYIFGFLGLYRVFMAIVPLAMGSIAAGFFWLVLGYWALYWVWVLSEIGLHPLPPELLSKLRTW
jgi:hypothetical protein